ncbi:MAG: phosphoglucomutase/phosphomannomutase family protein [Candidatus Aminicenantes bacterium]|nr:phosphoglucomutase/phosphomannomutase family protein [Candidatus Aminicenantes bacterium]
MIRFGTNGWRAVMGEEFTFHNVRLCVQAIANVLGRKFPGREITVIVNYDTRFLSERYAAEAAKVLSHNRIQVLLAERDSPTQAQAFQIIRRGAQGGINFTASFNPPQYNGLKYNTETGAPALPDETGAIETEIKSLEKGFDFFPRYPRSEAIQRIDLRADYLRSLPDKIDFEAIRASGLKIGVDLLYGTSREYLDEILEDNGIPVEEIHGFIDPYFGGIAPSCTEENLAELAALVREKNCDLGLATDADGDRFGIVDHEGTVVIQNLVLAMLLQYLVTKRGWHGGVARSVATTHLIDRIARPHDLPIFRTPVGFKFIADLLLKGEIMFGGEESAALGLRDHLPEKDGIIAGLLVAEMVAKSGRSLAELLQDLYKEYGERIGVQKSLPLTPGREKALRKLAKSPPSKLAGRYIVNTETIDGVKFDFADDDWLLIRFSGTEPLVRCYAEAGSRKDLRELLKAGLDKIG